MKVYAVIAPPHPPPQQKRPNALLSYPVPFLWALWKHSLTPVPYDSSPMVVESPPGTYHLGPTTWCHIFLSKDDLESFNATNIPLKTIFTNFSDVSISLGLIPRCFIKITPEESLDYVPPKSIFSITRKTARCNRWYPEPSWGIWILFCWLLLSYCANLDKSSHLSVQFPITPFPTP